MRLTRRGRGHFNDELVHDRMVIGGEIGDAKGVIMHEAFESLDELLAKMNGYSAEGAKMLAQRSMKGAIGAAVVHALGAFFRTCVLRTGFLDGREGFWWPCPRLRPPTTST